MTEHKNAHLMELYAQDAHETKTPWERWESKHQLAGWYDCRSEPYWDSTTGIYRRKSQTKAIDWSQVGDNVPIEVWDGPLEFCFQLGWRTMPTVSRWKDRSLETGRWVFNYGGVNPWPEGVEVEVTFRAADNRNEMVAEASRFRWGLGGREDDIIASRCVGLAKGWTYEEGE